MMLNNKEITVRRYADRENPWNSADIIRLIDLWATTLSAAEIGRQLGRSKNSVIGKVHRMLLVSRPSPLNGGKPLSQTYNNIQRRAVALSIRTNAFQVPKKGIVRGYTRLNKPRKMPRKNNSSAMPGMVSWYKCPAQPGGP